MAKIFIVEDNLPIRKLFNTLLKKNHTVHEFEDGKSVLEALDTSKPDCILLDILLPDINGTELIEKIKKHKNGEGVPILAVTGFAKGGDEAKYLSSGFDGYLTKPVDTATFTASVEKYLLAS
ncbi:MAG: response regulator [Candidatus Kapaibacteriales bacterium]